MPIEFNPHEYLTNPIERMKKANRLVHACPRCKGPMQDEEETINWGTCNFCFDKDYEESELFRKAGITEMTRFPIHHIEPAPDAPLFIGFDNKS